MSDGFSRGAKVGTKTVAKGSPEWYSGLLRSDNPRLSLLFVQLEYPRLTRACRVAVARSATPGYTVTIQPWGSAAWPVRMASSVALARRENASSPTAGSS